jgi:hypothetical protein
MDGPILRPRNCPTDRTTDTRKPGPQLADRPQVRSQEFAADVANLSPGGGGQASGTVAYLEEISQRGGGKKNFFHRDLPTPNVDVKFLTTPFSICSGNHFFYSFLLFLSSQ